MSTHEDTLMSDINVAEDPPTPEPPFNTSPSSPIEDNRSPNVKSDTHETDDAMQGIETKKYLSSIPSKIMNPDTMDWLRASSDIKVSKKATAQVHLSDTQKLEKLRDFDNLDEKKPLKTWNNGGCKGCPQSYRPLAYFKS